MMHRVSSSHGEFQRVQETDKSGDTLRKKVSDFAKRNMAELVVFFGIAAIVGTLTGWHYTSSGELTPRYLIVASIIVLYGLYAPKACCEGKDVNGPVTDQNV